MSFLMMASAAATAFYAIVKIAGMIQERRRAKGKGPWAKPTQPTQSKELTRKRFLFRRRRS